MDIDWNLVHDAGCTFDDSELPHHVSSKQEIQTLLASTEKLIGKPTVIENVLSKIDVKKTIFYRFFHNDDLMNVGLKQCLLCLINCVIANKLLMQMFHYENLAGGKYLYFSFALSRTKNFLIIFFSN